MDEKFLSTGSKQRTQLTWMLALSGLFINPSSSRQMCDCRTTWNKRDVLLPANVNILVHRVSLHVWSSPSFLNRVIYSFCYRHGVHAYNKLTDCPLGFQEVDISRFQDTRHMMVVRLSALHPGHLYPHEIFRVLIPPRSWVDPRATVRTEGLSQFKRRVTLSGINPATFRLVAQCLNEMSHRVPYDCL